MKPCATLLLTIDKSLEKIVTEVLLDGDHEMHIAHGVDDALDLVCRVPNLDLAIVDFGAGPHGMTLLRTISALRQEVPIIVITDQNQKHVEAIAHANGAAAGVHKPVLPSRLASAVDAIYKPTPDLALA
jgi:DNA-binding response OmpR family regulator